MGKTHENYTIFRILRMLWLAIAVTSATCNPYWQQYRRKVMTKHFPFFPFYWIHYVPKLPSLWGSLQYKFKKKRKVQCGLSNQYKLLVRSIIGGDKSSKPTHLLSANQQTTASQCYFKKKPFGWKCCGFLTHDMHWYCITGK